MRKPLYPHVPKRKEPLFPHRSRSAPQKFAEIDQIIADLNLLREEKVWIDTFKTKGASVIHIQTRDTATIISPPEDFTSPNYADRAMQIKWADGSEMVVDSNDFAPSSLQKQIAEITHGKPIPKFPTAEAAKEPWQMTREEFAEKYERASWHPEYIEARGKVRAIVDKTGKSGIELGREGNKEYLEAKAEMDAQLDIRNTPHVEHVRRALAEGKPVPPKVLADYPEIRRHPQAAPQTTSKEPFINVGERVRFIGSSKYRYETWPEGKWLEYGVAGTVTEYHPEHPEVRIRGEIFEALPPYAVVRWDLGGDADTAIDPEDEGSRWERIVR